MVPFGMQSADRSYFPLCTTKHESPVHAAHAHHLSAVAACIVLFSVQVHVAWV